MGAMRLPNEYTMRWGGLGVNRPAEQPLAFDGGGQSRVCRKVLTTGGCDVDEIYCDRFLETVGCPRPNRIPSNLLLEHQLYIAYY